MTMKVTSSTMSNKEFREGLEAVGLLRPDGRSDELGDRFDLRRAAALLGISRRTAFYYAFGPGRSGKRSLTVPAPVAQLLRLWVRIVKRVPVSDRRRFGLSPDQWEGR